MKKEPATMRTKPGATVHDLTQRHFSPLQLPPSHLQKLGHVARTTTCTSVIATSMWLMMR